jgi:hypothetical protein
MKNQLKNNKIEPETREKEKEFPGYPAYAPSEDIMNEGKRVDADLEDPGTYANPSNSKLPGLTESDNMETLDGEAVEPANPSDLTKEDFEALGERELSLDMGDDEQLRHRTAPVDFTGEDLDVPGTELDDAQESIGSEDEENNSYSLGGENHENLEEGKA